MPILCFHMNDSEIIDRLGGTVQVARLCRVRPPSVSEWRTRGIPAARRQFLELLRPDAFKDPEPARRTTAAPKGGDAAQTAEVPVQPIDEAA
ncbi:hypothetical protein GCM10028795_27230 [Lysobacter olei]